MKQGEYVEYFIGRLIDEVMSAKIDAYLALKNNGSIRSECKVKVDWQISFFLRKCICVWIKGGSYMYQERLMLSPKDILEKEFKIDTRGYRPQEVDKYLDIVIRDYEEAFTIMKELDTDKKELIEENIALKKEIRNLKTKLDVLSDSDNAGATNADLLRRISNLEKIIYGK